MHGHMAYVCASLLHLGSRENTGGLIRFSVNQVFVFMQYFISKITNHFSWIDYLQIILACLLYLSGKYGLEWEQLLGRLPYFSG